MKTQALKHFRAKLARQEPVVGLWVTLESATITEIAVALGLDWVVIDAEHGHLDWRDVNEHIRAALRSNTVALVRLAERSTSLAKRALDIGADGVVIPWMETAEQLREAVKDCRYPPEGRRGIGGERATAWGQCFAEHTAEANDNVLVIPIIESVRAVANIAEMCQVEGIDLFFFGPADFSASAGFRGQWEGPGISEQILNLKDTVRAAGKQCGLLATSIENLQERIEQGFRMPGIGADTGLLCRSLHQSLRAIDHDRHPATSLDPRDGRTIQACLPRPPAQMHPDRDALITTLEESSAIELHPRVIFQPLVGKFNSARDLTTGIANFGPDARLDYHIHPCSESLIVLEGEMEIAVEGRVYRLGPMDNIVIPRWLPHSAWNPDSAQPARIHVAFPMSVPEREPVTRDFARIGMPKDSTGRPGAERVNRFDSASRTHGVGSGAEFIDFFNSELVPGIEMSGGFARFQPGGRLPAHIHDFDESICITAGTASCQVEGRSFSLSGCATAMVPRGRVHYFVNNSTSPMDMIWVYAGPMPERIVVDESCGTSSRDSWSEPLSTSGCESVRTEHRRRQR